MDGARGRWVVHLDLDAFFASVEQLTRPTLRGRPVLVGGHGGRGVVAGASYEARVFGARSAMPMHQARRLVGVAAVVVPPRGAVYRVASHRVFEVIRTVIPVVEQLSLDEAFGEPAELVGAPAAAVYEFCEQLRSRVRDETGLVASVGAGSGKQVAKIASDLAKPDGVRVVDRTEQQTVLDALPVRRLWGIGPVTEERLHRLGIETIGQFAALTEAEVTGILGEAVGSALHRLARGLDDRPVAERAEAKQLSAESTFETDLTTIAQLRDVVGPIAEHAHRRLLGDGRGARTVTVKLRKADMGILTRSATLPYPTTDLEELSALARRLLLDPVEVGPIRLLGVGFSGLTELSQEALFTVPITGTVTDSGKEDIKADTEADTKALSGVGDDVIDAGGAPLSVPATGTGAESPIWRLGDDVAHPEFGHGWVQGAGHGVVTVRFETRSTGPGPARTFHTDEAAALRPADPVASLDWLNPTGR